MRSGPEAVEDESLAIAVVSSLVVKEQKVLWSVESSKLYLLVLSVIDYVCFFLLHSFSKQHLKLTQSITALMLGFDFVFST